MSWCNNKWEHEQEGRDDFRSGGYFGSDLEKERRRDSDPCAEAYMQGFERARRDEQEERERQEDEERRMEAERAEAAIAEDYAQRQLEEELYHREAQAASSSQAREHDASDVTGQL